MAVERDPLADAARRGFTELLQDRLPHLPGPATAAMADAVFTVAGLGPWAAWPETVDLGGRRWNCPRRCTQ